MAFQGSIEWKNDARFFAPFPPNLQDDIRKNGTPSITGKPAPQPGEIYMAQSAIETTAYFNPTNAAERLGSIQAGNGDIPTPSEKI